MISSDFLCMLNLPERVNWRRWAFLFSYALHMTAWLCYFRHFWFSETLMIDRPGRVLLMWFIRFAILLYSPFAIQQIIGFAMCFPKWAVYDKEKTEPKEESFPPLVIRVVSRGDDVPLLESRIKTHATILERLGVKNFLYQLVVEKPNALEGENVEVVVVPQKYQTPKGTLYKARNLQYAVSHPTSKFEKLRTCFPDVYILHLDEETLVSLEAMTNCMRICRSNKFRFATGSITYGWYQVASPLATFCDSWRVALDVGAVYFTCHMFYRCLVVKGGFFLMRNDLEEVINWDFGPHLTGEDSHLIRLLFNMGEPADYIDGVVLEESPVNLLDFIKQRSRWLVSIVRDYYVSEEKFTLTFSFVVGFVVWFGFPLTTFCLLFGVILAPLDNFYPVLDDFITIIMASLPFYYFYGALLNFRLSTCKRLAFSIIQLSGVPMLIAMMIESCGVFHAIYTVWRDGTAQAKYFHLTKKAAVKRIESYKLR